MDNTEEAKVKDLLKEIQLDQYYRQIHGKLRITRLSHFDHVTEEDLDDLGMAKPEQRRLIEGLKKAKKKSLFSSFRRKKSKKSESQTESAPERTSCYGVAGDSLTCLVSEQSLKLYEMLGNGAFGYVRRGTWMKNSHKKVDVAVKCLKAWNDKAFQQMQMEFIKEANAMSLLDHPHIIRLHGVVLSVPMMLVTELAPLGCLLARLREEPHNFTISGLSDFVVQIASGMAYLESHRFVHRDLAARNLLLESYEKVKIGDFGMMRVLSEDDDHYTMRPSGKIPFAWCPHEVLKFRKFSHASDVWAFGITVLELFSYGMEPWPGLNGAEILEKVDAPFCERPKRPEHCPPEMYSILMSHCWAHEPHQRARFSMLKKMVDEAHPINSAAVFPYESKSQQNLSFQEGDIITLLEASPDVSWWKGQSMRTRQVGMFPSELVESGLRRVSPVNTRTSPKPRSSGKKRSKQCNQLPNCDCGSAHIYETPILLYSPDSLKTGSSCSTTFSSRSVESDLTSSTEVDSGYSSSVDIRRFNCLNGENSSEQQNANLGGLYENTSIRKQYAKGGVYELMSPAVGPVSSPIPIPGQSRGGLRFAMGQREASSTPPSGADQRCPLDFSNPLSPQLSVSQKLSPSPAPTKTSASLPTSSVMRFQEKSPRLSQTVSPPASKKSQRDSGPGETFAQEMLTFLKGVGVDNSPVSSSSKEEEDIYEELTGPFVATPSNPEKSDKTICTSGEPLKAHKKHSYENHVITVEPQSNNEHDVSKGQNNDDFDRIRCNSAYQMENDHGLRDARCNTWPTQQVYDNHKLKDADMASSGKCCYDNHKLRPSPNDTRPSTDACYMYDNWKIKNTAGKSEGTSPKMKEPLSEKQSSQDLRPCYENVELQQGKLAVKRGELPHKTATSAKSEQGISPNQGRTTEQSYENCILNSAQLSYENIIPKERENGESVYENCETVDKKRENWEEILGIAIPRCKDQNDSNARKLCHSLPTNCHCVEVIPDDIHGFLNMILEKRNRPVLTRVGSAGAIPVTTEKGDNLIISPTSDSGDNLDFQDHPVPPPRWKRLARLKRTQSLMCCPQHRWEMTVSPELATVLSKRLSGTVEDTSAGLHRGGNLMNGSHLEEAGADKQCFPPPANSRIGAINNPRSRSRNDYENVMLPSKFVSEEPSPPELPPKLRRSNKKASLQNSTRRVRALHYENVDGVNGFHVVGNQHVTSKIESDSSPPPLPRKLSQTKTLPMIPSRVDLEQKC